MTKHDICNDSIALNDLLINRGIIPEKKKIDEDYYGEVILIMKGGMVKHVKKHEGIQVD
jgi:hypothetical protein